MHTHSTHSLITPSVNFLVASYRSLHSARLIPGVELSTDWGEGIGNGKKRETNRYGERGCVTCYRKATTRRYCFTQEKDGCYRVISCNNVGNTYGEAIDYDVGQDYFRFAPRIDPRNHEIDVRSITEREREREREREIVSSCQIFAHRVGRDAYETSRAIRIVTSVGSRESIAACNVQMLAQARASVFS